MFFDIIAIMKKAIITEQTPENIQQVLSLLAHAPAQLQGLSESFSPDQMAQPLGSGERSPVEVLAHLINTETLTAESIYLALMLKEPLLHKVHAERDLGKLLRLDQYSYQELLEYFSFRRKMLLNVLEPLTDKQWARMVQEEGKQRRESVYWRARGQALHELDHIEDIQEKLT